MNDDPAHRPNPAQPELAGQPSMARMQAISVCGATDVGCTRDHNEDAFAIADMAGAPPLAPGEETRIALTDRGVLVMVCDGMGGHAAGEVAAAMAAETIERELRSLLASTPPADSLREALLHASRAIFEESRQRDNQAGMGTTCTAGLLLPDRVVIAEVGDSRAYLWRAETLTQLTRDQSLVTTMLEAGLLSSEEAKVFPHTNVILQAMGISETLDPVISEVRTTSGDLILLCSDGLHGPVPGQDIAAILQSRPSLTDCARGLIEAALAAGGPDNVSVVLARYQTRS